MFFPCVVVCPVGFDAGDGASAGSVELAVDESAFAQCVLARYDDEVALYVRGFDDVVEP